MKIFFLQGDYNFCYYVRGYLPAVYSGNLAVPEFIFSGTTPKNIHEKALQADVIIFQRPSGKQAYKLAQLLKAKGKKIIMDNDDTYSGIPLHRLGNDKQREIAKEISNNLVEFAKLADGVTVSTHFLADEYAKVNKNVVVLKNCIDPLDKLPCKENKTGKFRVGFIGSVTSNDDYIHIKEQIKQLDDRGDCTIVIMGVKYKDGDVMPSMGEDAEFWGSLKNVEWHTVVPVMQYMSKLASLALDVAIIPRKEHYFNQCKSNLKFLEMSLVNIPVIAQGFSDGTSPYEQDRGYLTLVTNNDEWYTTIINCKDNYSTYKDLSSKACEYVLQNYNISTYHIEWTKQINKLCNFQQTS